MFGDFRYLLALCCVVLTVGGATLPSFTIQRNQFTSDDCLAAAEGFFGPDDYSITLSDERFIVFSSDGSKRVECDTISGGIWATDDSELFNTANGPPADLPSEEEAFKLGKELVERLHLLPKDGQLIIKEDRSGGTYVAHEYEDGSGGYTREEYYLDISVYYNILIIVPDYPKGLPLTGGGGKFQVTFGRGKRLIAFQGLWRRIVDSKPYEIFSQEEADAAYAASVAGLGQPVNFTSFLAYYSEPFGSLQKIMLPVYVYEGETVLNGQTVPIRPQATRSMKTTSASKPGGNPPNKRRSLDNHILAVRTHDDNDTAVFEAAAEWLGAPYGLALSEQNAEGFKSGVWRTAPIGNFTYEKSNQNVLGSDFVSENDIWVDTVDMLFYTGHANKDGWMVAEPGTGAESFVDYTSFGTRPEPEGDLLGQLDLEWLIIAACGPHQDQHINPSDGNVFDRWRGIFDGLHIMFGYASESVDTAEEGAKFMKYAQEGYSLIDAWFRTAKDLQSSDVIVSAMWTEGARDDHLPGYGCVSGDNPEGSKERWIMWTTC